MMSLLRRCNLDQNSRPLKENQKTANCRRAALTTQNEKKNLFIKELKCRELIAKDEDRESERVRA